MTNNNFSSPKIFNKKYSNVPINVSNKDKIIKSSPTISSQSNNSSNIKPSPIISSQKEFNNLPNIYDKEKIIKLFPTPNINKSNNYPQIYLPPISQKVEVKTGIFESIKSGFFMSMGMRVFDEIFGSREVKVIENKENKECLELKKMLEKCMLENNNGCKEFYENMKKYNCKV